jgi:hypothetical protein
MREWINSLAAAELTEAQLRRVARDKKAPALKRAAAERLIRLVEAGDMADFEPYLAGEKSLEDLRRSGINTEVVKKAKARSYSNKDGGLVVEREVELHDRAGVDFDRVCDQTDGKPTQRVEMGGIAVPTVIEIITPLTRQTPPPTD